MRLPACWSRAPDGNAVCRMWQRAKCATLLSVFSITLAPCLLAGGYSCRGAKMLWKLSVAPWMMRRRLDQFGVEGEGLVVEDSVSSSSSLCSCLWSLWTYFIMPSPCTSLEKCNIRCRWFITEISPLQLKLSLWECVGEQQQKQQHCWSPDILG